MSNSFERRPILRWPLDIQQVEHQGEQLLLIIDPEGVLDQPLILPAAFLPIISRLDGKHSLGEILAEGEPFGLTAQVLEFLVSKLEESFLLDGIESRGRLEKIYQQFRDSSVRMASHAGRVYSADPSELRQELARYIRETDCEFTLPKEQGPVVAMISPHIDYRRGWQTYGSSYQALKNSPRPDVIFLIGTAHQPGKSLFHLTTKDFETPLGVVPTNQAIVNSLASGYGKQRAFADEILHRREHSLELQLPFISYRYALEEMPTIVPILVGSFHHLFDRDGFPADDPEVLDFIDALAEQLKTLKLSDQRVLFYAGVDFAHVGQHFGDSARVSENGLPEIERRDRELLSAILSGDERKLFLHMAEDRDLRRICGYPSIYTMLSSMNRAGYRLRGTELEYRQSVDPMNDCVVTYASAYWTSQ